MVPYAEFSMTVVLFIAIENPACVSNSCPACNIMELQSLQSLFSVRGVRKFGVYFFISYSCCARRRDQRNLPGH